ncbi:hypothetical protein [Mesorhizobium sp. NZP2077]|uniref:hypothetical protein n=1 Tax=Mesorhizobium sp. NZP2077 TaxID=2483404 RepID=UPI001553A817|nr:hypothetical protein [Mesorhizobium sp. NZP2077]QKC83090.1 hypothetical protein EB232_17065 [Mesorhizobium sp. NZP2077]QKD16598.1 hypothetical protein HGP13_16845 [Mesorhizobium sp. NZP2077]
MSNGILFSMAPNLTPEQACASLRQHVFWLTSPVEAAHVGWALEIFASAKGDFCLGKMEIFD